MVEGTTLEMWRGGNLTVSSNLTSSATPASAGQRPYRLTVRTPAFQAVNPGSIPGRVTSTVGRPQLSFIIYRMQSEHLRPEEFDAHLQAGTLRLSFVGMSNAGKSYRSKVLARERDFLWYQVDEEIQKELGFATMGEISAWLGYPASAGYKEREATYLELENKFTREASMKTGGKNFVFDTTGSVVHLQPETIQVLKENCLVVHLDIGEGSLEKMVEKFFIEPKPVSWGEYFVLQEGESEIDALRRSYPVLLQERLRMYRALAHINLPAESLRDTSAEETLAVIRAGLPQ